MDETRSPWTLRAQWILPVATAPLRHGFVTVAGDRVESVRARPPEGPFRDLGNVAVLPGLVNAHTHLEFSELVAPLGEPGTPLADWIADVIEYRRRLACLSEREVAARRSEAIVRGLRESVAGGSTAVGEIATSDLPLPPAVERPSGYCVFRELMGWTSERVLAQEELARHHVRELAEHGPGVTPGLSPHAPYTASPELVERACRLSRAARIPVAMHLAESAAEREFLDTGRGPLRDLLERFDAWVETACRPGTRVGDLLRILAGAHRGLVIHGNYLQPSDLEFLGERRDCLSVIYCPRTHDFFAHAEYPLAAMLRQGVAVAVGTDSRASNPDLSMLAELRFVARRHPQVRPAQVWELGTRAAAAALGWGDVMGGVVPGMRADFTILPIAEGVRSEPEAALLDAPDGVRAVVRGGRLVWTDAGGRNPTVGSC